MSAATLTAAAPLLEPLERSWAVLLRTRKRDGGWVGTPVNLAARGARAYFGTPANMPLELRLKGTTNQLYELTEVRTLDG